MTEVLVDNWLEEKKRQAKTAYENCPIPDKVSHLWKYSDPECFEYDLKNLPVCSSGKLKLSVSGNLNNVVIMELSEAYKNEKYKELILKYFGKHTESYPNRLALLNESIWSSGYFLCLKKNQKVEEPITVKLSSDGVSDFCAVRNLIVLEEGSSINLIDEIVAENKTPLLINLVSEIFLDKNSKLNYANIQLYSKEVTSHNFQRAKLEEKSELTNVFIALGGKISKVDLGANLSKSHAQVTTYGIVLGDNNQKFDHHTTVEHNAPYTKSDLNFRVALKGKARSAYTGNLKISHEAIKSDAHQENRNLLLSADAKAESIPELEILTNDVTRCNHGVTVGQIDKDQLYYLMTRGLEQGEAEQIIIEGFLEPTLSKIPDKALNEEVSLRIKKKLGVV